jgi:ribonucleoside-diphosphate reductase beta chain
MEAKEAERSGPVSADREDFKASSDPALQESADRGQTKLLSYEELYALWERQHWATQDLDFSRDRLDWEGFGEEERFQRMYGLASFFVGEQRVTDELGPIMRACQTESQRIFLSTQIADEARHVRFFDAFYENVGVLDSDDLRGRLEESQKHLNENFGVLFDQMLKGRVDRLAANPDDTECLVECVTLYHMVIEGMLALTGQHFIIDYNVKEQTLPGFVEGFNNVARDEHRHVAFGARFLREKAQEDPRYEDAIKRMMQEALPVADAVLSPPWVDDPTNWELFGVTAQETREFAVTALTRRLKVIGLSL